MRMKKYFAYLEDKDNFYKIAVPATSEQDAIQFCNGNGEVIKVKEITEEYPISLSCVLEALNAYGFGKTEKDLIIRTLARTNIAE